MSVQWIGLVVLLAVTNEVFSAITLTDKDSLPKFKDVANHTINNVVFTLRFGLVADLDEKAKEQGADGESVWVSYMRKGQMTLNDSENGCSVFLDDTPNGTVKYTTKNSNDKGRGFGLSEMVTYKGQLLAVDDETGIVYVHTHGKFLAWVQVMEHAGSSNGMQIEWAFVKDELLYVGTNSKHSTWVATIDSKKKIEYVDWKPKYDLLKSSYHINADGYILHESIVWSEKNKQYVFLPKAVSHKSPNDPECDKNESVITTIMTLTDKNQYTEISTVVYDTGIGFSSFKFVPGTDDKIIVASYTKKTDKGGYNTYIVAFNTDFEEYLSEVFIGPEKYEGFEFI